MRALVITPAGDDLHKVTVEDMTLDLATRRLTGVIPNVGYGVITLTRRPLFRTERSVVMGVESDPTARVVVPLDAFPQNEFR
jgi:hypothetical protein